MVSQLCDHYQALARAHEVHRESQISAEQVALVLQMAKAYMAAVARPCPRGFVLDHQWASRAVLGISVWVANDMAEAAVVSARHRAHVGSPLSDGCLRIAGRRHHLSPSANHLRFPRPRPHPESLAGVSYNDRWGANKSLREQFPFPKGQHC